MTIQHPFLKQLELPGVDTSLVKARTLATHYGKSNDYIILQPFTVSPIVWEGVSLIHKKFLITLPKNASIVRLPDPPANVNFCPCIFWRISEGVGARYKLWEDVGEKLYAPVYTSQRIPSTFILEIWNTEDEVDITLASSLQILLSTLTASIHLCGDGGEELAFEKDECTDFIFDSEGLSVDYALGDYWTLSGLCDVVFHDTTEPPCSNFILSLPNLNYWYDSGCGGTLFNAVVGGVEPGHEFAIRRWEDKSPNAWHLTNDSGDASSPVRLAEYVNDRDAVQFHDTATPRWIRNTTFDAQNGATKLTRILVGYAPLSTPGLMQNQVAVYDNQAGALCQFIDEDNSVGATPGTLYTYLRPSLAPFSENVYGQILGVAPWNQRFILIVTIDYDLPTIEQQVRVYLNGLYRPFTNVLGSAISARSDSGIELTIARFGLGGFWWGDQNEVISCSAVISESLRRTIENYASNKWGVILEA